MVTEEVNVDSEKGDTNCNRMSCLHTNRNNIRITEIRSAPWRMWNEVNNEFRLNLERGNCIFRTMILYFFYKRTKP